MTPSRHSASSLITSNSPGEGSRDSREERRASSHSLTRSPMVLKPSHWSREMKARQNIFAENKE